ncbi:hypothetical protein BGZ83_010842 [Gryganskiella cystojenkinii]|nr:hypothetical protein BGZ83_010842 [Gryganskiella cystojenkinii]
MALKQQQQTAPFQLRNPYRLDRPAYDPMEVWESAIAEEEDTQRRLLQSQIHHQQQQLQQLQQHQQTQTQTQTHPHRRPLPPQPLEYSVGTPGWGGIKRIRDYQKKNSSEKRFSKLQQQQLQQQQSQEDGLPSYNGTVTDNASQYSSYFGQSWFGHGAFNRPTAPSSSSSTLGNRHNNNNPSAASITKGAASQLPVPSIMITHHIDNHSELTFERHVEWLTQTALWWDMPVVHLYPAPESPALNEYVATAASKFSSWVNFVKILAKDAHRLGPGSTALKAPAPPTSTSTPRVKGSRSIKGKKETSSAAATAASSSSISTSSSSSPSESKTDHAQEDGGMVMGQSKRKSSTSTSLPSPLEPSSALAASPTSPATEEPIIGYVFVGSADEQAQYHHVFETLERLFPKIEIRYINSFEPHHLQTRRQQELREEPCLHGLSWIHYWSAAKESQVLQSKIVNEVVRVRPMWVNNENLHRNYTPPPPPPPTPPIGATVVIPTSSSVVSVSSSDAPTTDLISSPSVYIVNGKEEQGSMYGVSSSVSITTLHDMDRVDGVISNKEDIDMNPFMLEIKPRQQQQGQEQQWQEQQGQEQQEQQKRLRQVHESISSSKELNENEDGCASATKLRRGKFDLKRLPAKRPSLNRTQSSLDIHREHHGHQHLHHDKVTGRGTSSGSRQLKTWALTSSIVRGDNDSGLKSGAEAADLRGYRRSVSTPMLLFTNDKAERLLQGDDEDAFEDDDDCSMSPPPSSPTSTGSPTSTKSDSSSSKTSISSTSSTSSMRLSHRLANLAQRLGVYKMRGSLMMVDM